MAVFVRRITWTDAAGNLRNTQLIGNGGLQPVQLALLNASQADYVTESEGQVFVNSAPSPPGGSFANVDVAATLWFGTAVGYIISVTLPAPSLSIFLADQETVDITNADVVSIASVAVGLLTTLGGDVATSLIGGIRS